MSENLFSNLYNRVLSFFQRDRMQDGESSKDTATNRLKLVLMQDRSNLDGATMQKMREQLISVISKYIEIDQDALDLNLEADGDEIALMLNIPVIRARTKEEIEELEAKEQEALKASKDDAADNTENSEESEESKDTENEEHSENPENEDPEDVSETSDGENNIHDNNADDEELSCEQEMNESETSDENTDSTNGSEETKKSKKNKND